MAAQDKKRKGKSSIKAAEAYKLGKRDVINKAKRAKRVAKEVERKRLKRMARHAAGKPARGTARKIRREKARAAAVAAAPSVQV